MRRFAADGRFYPSNFLPVNAGCRGEEHQDDKGQVNRSVAMGAAALLFSFSRTRGYPRKSAAAFFPLQPFQLADTKKSEASIDSPSVPFTFLFIEKGRSSRPRGTGLNPLDKGKSFSRTRYRP